MMPRTTVVISEGRSNHPVKRSLEVAVATTLMARPDVDLLVVPHLYDLSTGSPALTSLCGVVGPFVVVSWLYPRAAHWTLDQLGIRGRLEGVDDVVPQRAPQPTGAPEPALPVSATRPAPRRSIYHVDLRAHSSADALIAEIARKIDWCMAQLEAEPLKIIDGARPSDSPAPSASGQPGTESKVRRWYPVIDYDRCTNCMECIDFCLFGVYGIDAEETILVEQPDSCRKGCPACSRVCPENAIMFPEHKTPAIAGDPNALAGAAKLNLSDLFGGGSAADVALQERDQHLRDAGREPADTEDPAARNPSHSPADNKDRLDALVDRLDELDL